MGWSSAPISFARPLMFLHMTWLRPAATSRTVLPNALIPAAASVTKYDTLSTPYPSQFCSRLTSCSATHPLVEAIPRLHFSAGSSGASKNRASARTEWLARINLAGPPDKDSSHPELIQLRKSKKSLKLPSFAKFGGPMHASQPEVVVQSSLG